ncbi:MAG: crossover junction endodeoxyribonuclease RuvC [Candidatus Omnitrophica bacterium]|nr:crossover junction endodeoxyribonuclease RuvC [Candidatus Omnitrophota bacterium]
MRVLGVDPGLRCVGYGVIEFNKHEAGRTMQGRNPRLKLIEAGIIRTSSKDKLTNRLNIIYNGLIQVLRAHRPDVVALEELYSHYKNPKTAIMMAHARGVICLAAAQAKINVAGYAPRKVKKAVTGAGAAAKSQMQRVIMDILGLKVVPKPHDVADALALAITHINVSSRKI